MAHYRVKDEFPGELAFLTEIAAMKEDGLIQDYWQWLALPERVRAAWRVWASNRTLPGQKPPPADMAEMSDADLRALVQR